MSGDAREAHQDAPGARGAVGRAEGAPRVVDAPQRAAPCDGEACPLPVRVGDVTLPGDLPSLLMSGWQDDRWGWQTVQARLTREGMPSTLRLLQRDRAAWFSEPGGRCYVSGCGGIRDALEEHLQRQWGVGLGALYRAPERAREPFRWADPNTWPGDLDVTKPWTWSDEVCAQPVPARYARFVPAEMWLQLRREVA